MDTTLAHDELGWEPRWDAGEALIELVEGVHEGAAIPTPPLERRPPAGVGGRDA